MTRRHLFALIAGAVFAPWAPRRHPQVTYIVSRGDRLLLRGNAPVTIHGIQTSRANPLLPCGVLVEFAPPPPSGWLHCDGRAVSRETYADLFAVLGTSYGAGDGRTTFNLPDLRALSRIWFTPVLDTERVPDVTILPYSYYDV